MKKIILFILVLFMHVFLVPSASALDKTADSSASLSPIVKPQTSADYLVQKKAMRVILTRYNSDLTDEADSFLDASYKYELDPYLLVSISGLESGFGRAMIDGSYNAYGWGGGTIYFENWDDGIETISAALRKNYYNKGAKSVYDVGRKYAASPTWAVRVEGFMNAFRKEEARQKQLLSVI